MMRGKWIHICQRQTYSAVEAQSLATPAVAVLFSMSGSSSEIQYESRKAKRILLMGDGGNRDQGKRPFLYLALGVLHIRLTHGSQGVMVRGAWEGQAFL